MIKRLKRHWKGIAVGLVTFVMSRCFQAPSTGGWWVEPLYNLRDFVASVLVGLAVDLWTIHAQIRLLIQNREAIQSSLRDELAPVVNAQLRSLIDKCQHLTNKVGITVPIEVLRDLIGNAYSSHRSDHFVVLQKFVPSNYAALFPEYRDHFDPVRLDKPGYDVRVLVASEQDLLADWQADKAVFRSFLSENSSHKMLVLQVDPNKCIAVLERLGFRNVWIFGSELAIFAAWKKRPLVRSLALFACLFDLVLMRS